MNTDDDQKVTQEAEVEMQRLFKQLILDPLKIDVVTLFENTIKPEVDALYSVQSDELKDLLEAKLKDMKDASTAACSDLKAEVATSITSAQGAHADFMKEVANVEGRIEGIDQALTTGKTSNQTNFTALVNEVTTLRTRTESLEEIVSTKFADVEESLAKGIVDINSQANTTVTKYEEAVKAELANALAILDNAAVRLQSTCITDETLKAYFEDLRIKVETVSKRHIWTGISIVVILEIITIFLVR